MEKDELNKTQPPATSTIMSSNGSARNRDPPSRNQNSDHKMFVKEFEASVLSSLDKSSYELALSNDTKSVLENYVFPMCIPWYKPKAPLIRTMPRDIDDMPGLWFVDDIRMYQSNERGLLGFGAFDQGMYGYHHRRSGSDKTRIFDHPEASVDDSSRSDSIPPDSELVSALHLGCEDDQDATFIASARRSADPGTIEISAMLSPFRSLEAALFKYQAYGVLSSDPWLRNDTHDINRAVRIIEADRKVTASSMPLCMSYKQSKKYFRQQPFLDNARNDPTEVDLNAPNLSNVFIREYKRLDEEATSSKERFNASLKRWNLSFKVENVSSRATLFSSSSNTIEGDDDTILFTRPLLCSASIPAAATKSGKQGMQADGKVEAHTSHHTKNKDGDDRAKDGCKRRTRLVWSSSLMSGSTSNGSKLPFSDVLTGQKIDGRCPREVNVAVRLNGKLLSKPSNVMAGSNIDITSKARVPKPGAYYSPTKALDVEASLHDTCDCIYLEKVNESPGKKLNRYELCNRHTSYEVEYLPSSFDRRQKLKSAQANSNKTGTHITQEIIVPMKHGGSHVLKQVEPHISYATLSDYSSKIFCEIPGRMQGSSVHTLLSIAARALGNVCSICWTGNEASEVIECSDCGLLVHLECCLDKGKLTYCSNDNTNNIWQCSTCLDTLTGERRETDDTKSIQQQLMCRKSLRLSKLPSRFLQKSGDTLSDNQLYHKRLSKGRPSHKCTMCPHSGGAMSKLGGRDVSEINDRNQRWTHEICRIWGHTKQGEVLSSYVSNKKTTPAGIAMPSSECFNCNASSTCALCGMGVIHNIGKEKEEILSHRSSSFSQDNGISSAYTDLAPGLVRCAAKSCYVTFHPMCAILSSKLRCERTHAESSKNNRGEEERSQSKIYSLTLVNVMRIDERTSATVSTIVPLAFCGIHNPNREDKSCG